MTTSYEGRSHSRMVERNVLVDRLSQPLCALERVVPSSKVPYRGRTEITTPASASSSIAKPSRRKPTHHHEGT